MSEDRRFRVTITLDAEDLSATPGDDQGSKATIVQKTVSSDTRHLIEKSLSQTMNEWGDAMMEQRSGGQSGKGPTK